MRYTLATLLVAIVAMLGVGTASASSIPGYPSYPSYPSYYGQISTTTWLPRTHYVHSYFRSNGTFVYSYWRSCSYCW
jgi:hypothetical protein